MNQIITKSSQRAPSIFRQDSTNVTSQVTDDTIYGLKKLTLKTNKMKKVLLFIAVIAIISGCSKKEAVQDDISKWNGYEEFYKAGEMYKDLRTRHEVVGTVTYGIDDNANFYVKYETTGDWELVKTSMFAGKWKEMPKRKRRRSKTYSFPHKSYHSPYVTEYTYTIPLTELPPAEEPGFIVAANARVFNSNKCHSYDNYTYKNAWAEWDRRFSCRTWGGYSNYYYNQPYEPHTLLYGAANRSDSLAMYLIDGTDGTATLIATEYIGTPPDDTYDGTAFDPNNNTFYFTNYDLQELWLNNMDSTDSYKAGDLSGISASGTFNDGNYYYVDANTNDIMQVELAGTDSLYIVAETSISTVPGSVTVNDIAFDPTGDYIYIVGAYNNNVELIELELVSDTYASTAIDISDNAQIAYGDDGVLYAVETDVDGDVIISSIDPNSGLINPIVENGVEEIDLFSDISKGPIN